MFEVTKVFRNGIGHASFKVVPDEFIRVEFRSVSWKTAGVKEEIGKALVDAGYWSDANLRDADPKGPELLIATNKDWKQRKAMREQAPPRGRIPTHCSAGERMERKLLTTRGRELYKLRSQTVEPVFG